MEHRRIVLGSAIGAVVVVLIAAFVILGDGDSDRAVDGPRTPRATASKTTVATTTPTKTTKPTPTPKPTKPPAPRRPVFPFTGLQGNLDAPVLAVKIDNVAPARPPTGLTSADIVYIEPVEAGLSRLLAVFSSRLPETIGPIRSARESDVELLRQFGQPAFAYSGAQTKLLPVIAAAPVYDVSPATAGGAYYRSDERSAPHNLYASPSELLDRAPEASRAKDIGFRYGKPPGGGRETDGESVSYSAFDVDFEWSERGQSWRVSMDGDPVETAGGGRIAPKTVVIQYATIRDSRFGDSFGNKSPYVETVGTGDALVLRNGRAYDVTWSRPAADRGTTFTTKDGQPMRFAAGQTWVVFAAAD